MAIITPKIIVIVSGGCVELVHAEGITEAGHAHVVVVDYDCEGEADSELETIDGAKAAISVSAFDPMNDQTARDVRRAWERWSVS